LCVYPQLKLQLKINNCGNPPQTHFTRTDNYDTKKLAAIEDPEHTTLGGKCASVTRVASHVTSQGITTHTSCYYAGVDGDEDGT
jgi:hypothetical protein